MAHLPKPISVGEILTDIAGSLGAAARKIVETSRSDIGGLAVKGARIDIEFEMASRLSSDGVTSGLGVRTFSFGFGVNREAVDERRTNRGRIEVEIVAVPSGTDAAAVPKVDNVVPPPMSPDKPTPELSASPSERMKHAVAALRGELKSMSIPPKLRRDLGRRLADINKMIIEGRLAAATAALLELQPLFQNLADDGG